jgi:hypothetical protein
MSNDIFFEDEWAKPKNIEKAKRKRKHKPNQKASQHNKKIKSEQKKYLSQTNSVENPQEQKIPFLGKIKCLLGFHNWDKYMGTENYGNGKFLQRYICLRCRKIKKLIK